MSAAAHLPLYEGLPPARLRGELTAAFVGAGGGGGGGAGGAGGAGGVDRSNGEVATDGARGDAWYDIHRRSRTA